MFKSTKELRKVTPYNGIQTISNHNQAERENTELEKKHKELEAKCSELAVNHEALKKEHANKSPASTTELNKAISEKDELEKKYKELKEKHSKLTDDHNKLKSNENGKEEEKGHKDNETTASTNAKTPVYDKLKSTIDSIKSDYKVQDGNIIHKNSNTICYEKTNEKLDEKDNEHCNKIQHLHNLMDSLGMDKDEKGEVDESHKEFHSFMVNDTLDEKHKLSFNKLHKDYAYTCNKGKKVSIEKATAIKYKDAKNSADDKECFKMKEGKISTYGENSFSERCDPIVNTYKTMQKNDTPHYDNTDLTSYDDKDFHELLKSTDTDNQMDL